MDVQVAETEPATRWRATTGDGAHEVGIFLGRIHRGQAVAFAVRDREGSLCVVTEAVDPASPTAREDVGAVMRDVVRRCAEAGKAMLFDGHVSDPHYPQVLATIPHVTGPGLHLIRLGQPDDRPG